MSRSSISFLVPTPIPVLLFAIVLLSLTSGCGDGKFPVGPAKGKVMFNGQPVTKGTVTFSPIEQSGSVETGKPATAAVGPDGTFVLTTHDRFDGAIVGKHSVQYTGSDGEEAEEPEGEPATEGSPDEAAQNLKRARERQAQRRSQYEQRGEIIVEVKLDGENDFTIEVFPVGR